jgi:GntR family transcriptional regulator / MocR family aminotransferase
MRRWELAVALDERREQPLFLQLASGIANEIQHGRLKPGESLPGSRQLAQLLGVNRNTVVAGYDELVAEGLVSTRIGGGTFVAEVPLSPTTIRKPQGDVPTYELAPSLNLEPSLVSARSIDAPVPGALIMSSSVSDTRLFPARSLARAFRRAMEKRGHALLADSGTSGHFRLRSELATMLSRSRGLPATPETVMVTRSIEQGIDLVARTLIRPGDNVVVEAFGYPPAWSVLRLAGANLLPVALDGDGLDVGALEKLLETQRIRAVFLTPHHQFPTTVTMSAQRRVRLAQLSVRYGFAIIEDDYDHEFHYAGKPILPIAAGPARANVIYVGSLANLLAPGISAGFVVAPAPVFERLVSLPAASDARGDAAMECAIAELFEDGELLRHVRRVRRIYEKRRDALSIALKRELGSAIEFQVADGGMAIWAQVDEAIDVVSWARAGAREGVLFNDASRYDFFHRDRSFLRLGFSYHDEDEIGEGVKRMAKALKR